MKKLILMNVVVGLLVSGVSLGSAGAKTRPVQESLDLRGDRPSCELLAWRWAQYGVRRSEILKVLEKSEDESRISEARQVMKRIAEEDAEEGLEKVVQTVIFKVPGVTPENFQWTSARTPSFAWANVTENSTDLMDIKVTQGKVKVSVVMNYADYCFQPQASILKIEVAGRAQSLVWNTRHLDLDKYLAKAKKH